MARHLDLTRCCSSFEADWSIVSACRVLTEPSRDLGYAFPIALVANAEPITILCQQFKLSSGARRRNARVVLDDHNAHSKPFQWVVNPNKIIAEGRRGHQVLDHSG